MRRALFLAFLVGAIVLVAPASWLRVTTPMIPAQEAQQAQAALVFGAVVRDGVINPLHKERLDTAIELYSKGKVSRIVASNAKRSALIMQDYLRAQGIPAAAIELDTQAIHTPDTCHFEAQQAAPRRVIFISQKFHLPRIALQCARYDLEAQLVYADSDSRPVVNLATKIRVRGYRFLRESLLTWSALLHIYPTKT